MARLSLALAFSLAVSPLAFAKGWVTVLPSAPPTAVPSASPARPVPSVHKDAEEQQSGLEEMAGAQTTHEGVGTITAISTPPAEQSGFAGLSQVEWVREKLQSPALNRNIQRIVSLTQDPAFQRSSQSVSSNKHLKWLLVGYGLVIVGYIVVRRWMLSATDRWWTRLLVRLALIPVLYLGLFIVSYGVLGQPLLEMIWALHRAFA